jgi:hypothetical protein
MVGPAAVAHPAFALVTRVRYRRREQGNDSQAGRHRGPPWAAGYALRAHQTAGVARAAELGCACVLRAAALMGAADVLRCVHGGRRGARCPERMMRRCRIVSLIRVRTTRTRHPHRRERPALRACALGGGGTSVCHSCSGKARRGHCRGVFCQSQRMCG